MVQNQSLPFTSELKGGAHSALPFLIIKWTNPLYNYCGYCKRGLVRMVKQHILPPEIELVLMYATGIFWILTYLVLIYKGFKDKRCGMPFIALCGNITWELLYSFLLPYPTPENIIIRLWLFLDLMILFQFILYSRNDLPKP